MRKEDYKELNEIKYKVIDEKHNVLDNSDLVINNNQENLSDEEMLDNYIDTSIISYKKCYKTKRNCFFNNIYE